MMLNSAKIEAGNALGESFIEPKLREYDELALELNWYKDIHENK